MNAFLFIKILFLKPGIKLHFQFFFNKLLVLLLDLVCEEISRFALRIF